jgi:hypothetical protein
MANSDNVIKNLNRLKDKLLDLGKRNQMLFLKPKSKKVIGIEYPNWKEIYRLVVEGEKLRLVRKIDQLTIEEKEQLSNSLNPQKQMEENIYSNEDINLTKYDIPFDLIKNKLKENYLLSESNDFVPVNMNIFDPSFDSDKDRDGLLDADETTLGTSSESFDSDKDERGNYKSYNCLIHFCHDFQIVLLLF